MTRPMRLEFRIPGEEPRPNPQRRPDVPMRILVLGDLSGRGDGAGTTEKIALRDRPVMGVDLDRLETVFARCAPRLTLDLGAPELRLGLENLEGFHPDSLFESLGVFAALREMRARLVDPATFRAAAAELVGPAGTSPAPPVPAGGDEADLMKRLLGSGPVPAARETAEDRLREELRRALRTIVAEYVIPEADPRQEQLIAGIDRATSRQMNAVLHHRAFQSLESLWRSLQRLLSDIETGDEIEIFLLDASFEELAADIEAAGAALETTALYHQLVERGAETPGAGTWTVIVGAYSFGVEARDLTLLEALGAIASRAGGPFLGGAAPAIIGCVSLAETPDSRAWNLRDAEAEKRWSALRKSPWARWIGLALPRLLLRLPYGPATEPIERFAFDEFGEARRHESYLWGNPAFACATLLARSFRERGWSMSPGDHLGLEGLPSHVYRADGEPRLQPCAEVLLTQQALQAMLERGLMPFMSFPDRNAARLARFQSIADPPAPLGGAWNS